MSNAIPLAEHTEQARVLVGVWASAHKSRDEIDQGLAEFAVKCGMDEAPAIWRPYGGAKSWDELDSYSKAQKVSGAMSEVQYQFSSIVDNVMGDHMMSPEDRASTIADAAATFPGRLTAASKTTSMKSRLKGLFVREMAKAEAGPSLPEFNGTFKAVKSADGYRWVNVYSNTFRDRHKERFSTEAHADYERYVDETKDFPELWFWHIPGSRMGVADLVTQTTEGFMVASGTFDPGMEHAAKALSEMGELAVSHGFRYQDSMRTKDGTFLPGYRTFEISVLPPGLAANEQTGAVILKEEVKMLTPEKREAALRVLGAPFVESLEANLLGAVKSVNGDVVAFKAITEAIKGVVDGVDGPAGGTEVKSDDNFTSSITAALAPAMAAIAALTNLVGQNTEGQKALADRLDTVERTDGQKIAEKMKATAPFTASVDGSTVIDGRTAAAKEATAGLATGDAGNDAINSAAPWLAPAYKLMQQVVPVGE